MELLILTVLAFFAAVLVTAVVRSNREASKMRKETIAVSFAVAMVETDQFFGCAEVNHLPANLCTLAL